MQGKKMFNELLAKESGVDFFNKLTENDSVNYFNYGYMYMGGGIAIGDVNGDDLQDIYFTGNMVKNKLYLNKGNLNFEDVSSVSKVNGDKRWMTGITMADVNADGLLDIYVSVSGIWETTKNLLYINMGNNTAGTPIFKEMAEKYGIADIGNSVQGYFFDHDNDGDLDLYVINYPVTPFKTSVPQFYDKMLSVTDIESNTLYRNNGDNTFTDITEEAGLKSFNLSLSASISDYNNDGWMDIYLSSDFAAPDNFYFNNGDGTYTDQISKTTQQTAFFGMGSDVADFNNDGLLDFVQLDMTPEDNRRSKANMQSMNIKMFDQLKEYDFHTQYMQNALQLNVGNDKDGLPHFSNIPRMAGISLTDWSWASLFVDFDNDGLKDLFVTNGTRREINNKDYFKSMEKKHKGKKREEMDLLKFVEMIPSEKIPNYAYKNNDDLTFKDVSKDWGLDHDGFSNGTAYADLDNDGDLDLVVNNLDEKSIIYKNTSADKGEDNYVQLAFKGNKENTLGVGVKATIYQKDKLQYQQLMLSRGFQSSVPPLLHFGLGKNSKIDSLKVVWPDGKEQTIVNINSNKILKVNYITAINKTNRKQEKSKMLFEDISNTLGESPVHKENIFDDYYYQILLPHKMSAFGPALAVGDINNDGLDDFYFGGASGQQGSVYKQQKNGSFIKTDMESLFKKDAIKEDVNALFFDANKDGYQDLYVVSGGNEFYKNARTYQDRLYINDTKGGFYKATLPKIYSSGSKVIPADFDKDGDIDLFVGGRHTPRNYPLPSSSYVLRNDSENGKAIFTNVTEEIIPDLKDIGMVTDAVWTDYNNDDSLDLVVVGEWTPLTFFTNENGKFINKTVENGLEKTTGWWYSIKADDFDKDGDMDFIAGNLGLNYKYKASQDKTFDVYADDFDNNKSMDIVLGYYNDGKQYPVRGRQCSSQQIPAIEVKFKDYNSFATADLADVYSTQSLENALHYKAQTFASSYIENMGNGEFRIHNLPNEAQVSSVNNILTDDIDKDGNLDLVLSGNLYASEVETPRNDASYGLYLKGDGKGNFKPLPSWKSGLFVSGDIKNASWIKLAGDKKSILFAKNNDTLQMVKVRTE